MFAFLRGKRGNAFDRRKRRLEVARRLRRIVDATTPNAPPMEGESRCHKRYNRSVPVVVAPWRDDGPDVEDVLFGVSKDFSDLGVALLLPEVLETRDVVCGFWLDTPVYVLGEIARSLPFGAGFWQVGVYMNELLPDSRLADTLVPLINRLRPVELASV